ncbi:MAG: hypothetical protein J7K00_00875 [Candidatus Diapherotrites archaeon]|nr:hypothetical protein [Candidatus Diapherotrites archaeon]
MGIIADCSRDLLSSFNRNKQNLQDIFVENISFEFLYTMIGLSDGSQGIALNYNYADPSGTSGTKFMGCDCESVLKKNAFGLTELSAKVATMSALSQRFFNKREMGKIDVDFQKDKFMLDSIVRDNETVSIVGWGGLLDAAGMSNARKVNVVELQYNRLTCKRFDGACEKLGRVFNKQISCFGTDKMGVLLESDVICITASALCNNTMEDILSYCSNAREVIVHGPSGSIFPSAFFNSGVTGVLTYLVNVDLFSLSKKTPDIAREPNKYLEGVYLKKSKNFKMVEG